MHLADSVSEPSECSRPREIHYYNAKRYTTTTSTTTTSTTSTSTLLL